MTKLPDERAVAKRRGGEEPGERRASSLEPSAHSQAASGATDATGGPSGALAGMRLGFLYNHDTLHQVAHSAPMIGQLALEYPEIQITILASTDEQMALIRQQVPETVAAKLSFVDLRLSPALERLDRFARHIAPFKRVAILRNNLDLFCRFDALVVPEVTSSRPSSAGRLQASCGTWDRSSGGGRERQRSDLRRSCPLFERDRRCDR